MRFLINSPAWSALSGSKTYIVGVLMILLSLLKGDEVDLRMLMEGLGLMTLRAGVAKIGAKPDDDDPLSGSSNPNTTPTGSTTIIGMVSVLCLGCALLMQTGCSSVAPGNDPVVVNAERTTEVALETFDTFLKWEYENRETLSAVPEVRRAADFVRVKSPDWLATVRSMTKAYKSNRSPEAKANLDTALAVLRAGVREAQRHLEQAR